MPAFCIVCGSSEDEVEAMHYFPRNLEKSRKWQESMGMVYKGENLRNCRICNNHFSDECYINLETRTLKRDIIPTLLSASERRQFSGQAESTTLETEPVPCCSKDIDAPTAYLSRSQTPVFHPVELTDQSNPRYRSSLFKNIDGLSSVMATPRKKALMDLVRKKHDHIRKLKKTCKVKGSTIKKLYNLNLESSPLYKDVFKGMSSTTASFMMAQLRCAKRAPKGRRWTLDEKILSLALYKRSPKCYSLLRRLVVLPAKRTLTALLEKVPLKTGINKHLFIHLGKCLENVSDANRLCILMFDEMAIREHVQFNRSKQYFEGIEDFGNGRNSNKLANHALVFMAQGLRRNWKQPLAYYFTNGGIKATQLQKILREVLNAMDEANLKVVATVCDMGTANVKTLKDMGSCVAKPFFFHKDRKIFNIFDAPHLLKCTRNLFKKYNVHLPVPIFNGQILDARWADIKMAYENDQKSPLVFRALKKLRNVHLNPAMQMAMKVKIAAQVMSHTVAAYLFTIITHGVLPQRALATATFIEEVDQLFDSFNGTAQEGPDGKPVRCVVTEESMHMAYWKEAFEVVRKWKYIRKPQDINLERPNKPPSQVGWLHSIQAIQLLWIYLKSEGLKYLRPRALNQDPLENLFGQIRGGCGYNENPTVPQFISSLKTQIINGLTNRAIQQGNCEEDDATLLSDLRSFLEVDLELEPEQHDVEEEVVFNEKVLQMAADIEEAVKAGNLETLSVAYVAGYIAKRILRESENCSDCLEGLEASEALRCSQFIIFKEYSQETQKLTYPSENLVITVGHGITLLEEMLPKIMHENKIEDKLIKTMMSVMNFSWIKCKVHEHEVKHGIILGLCRIGIPWFCSRMVQNIKLDKNIKHARKRKIRKLQHN